MFVEFRGRFLNTSISIGLAGPCLQNKKQCSFHCKIVTSCFIVLSIPVTTLLRNKEQKHAYLHLNTKFLNLKSASGCSTYSYDIL